MAIQFMNPPGIYRPARGFSQVAKVGTLVLISGQTAQDETGQVVGRGDAKAQAERVYQNLQTALAALGATFANVVKLNSYYTDRAHMEAAREVRPKYLGGHAPASTSVIVSGLADPGYLMEVEAVVELPTP